MAVVLLWLVRARGWPVRVVPRGRDLLWSARAQLPRLRRPRLPMRAPPRFPAHLWEVLPLLLVRSLLRLLASLAPALTRARHRL